MKTLCLMFGCDVGPVFNTVVSAAVSGRLWHSTGGRGSGRGTHLEEKMEERKEGERKGVFERLSRKMLLVRGQERRSVAWRVTCHQ